MLWVLKGMLYFHHGYALGLERYALNTQGRDDDSSHIGKSVETCVLTSDDSITPMAKLIRTKISSYRFDSAQRASSELGRCEDTLRK